MDVTQRSQLTDDPEALGDRARLRTTLLVVSAIVCLVVLRLVFIGVWTEPAVETWATIFVSITLQALPFLVLGVTLSGAIAAFVSPTLVARALPRNKALAVPIAGAAGVLLPGCECGSVPIAGRLAERGVPAAAALTFLLAAPAINPIVLASTAVAFPNNPEMVLARFLASLSAAIIVGLLWLRVGAKIELALPNRQIARNPRRARTFRDVAIHDFLHAGGYLVIGALITATIQVAIPRSVLDAMGGSSVVAVITMAALAIVLSICSEADAFVAASLPQFSLTSRLVFLVVGPMVDIKLVALQVAILGKQVALRFAPLTLICAIACSVLIGWWLL